MKYHYEFYQSDDLGTEKGLFRHRLLHNFCLKGNFGSFLERGHHRGSGHY